MTTKLSGLMSVCVLCVTGGGAVRLQGSAV